MRPRGEIRQVLADTVQRLAAEHGAATFRQAAAAAQVGLQVARHTLDNMARAGELDRVGYEKVAGGTHWHVLYAPPAPADEAPEPWGGIERLAQAMQSFAAAE